MALPREITKKLRKADPELAAFVKAMDKINFRLVERIVKLEICLKTLGVKACR